MGKTWVSAQRQMLRETISNDTTIDSSTTRTSSTASAMTKKNRKHSNKPKQHDQQQKHNSLDQFTFHPTDTTFIANSSSYRNPTPLEEKRIQKLMKIGFLADQKDLLFGPPTTSTTLTPISFYSDREEEEDYHLENINETKVYTNKEIDLVLLQKQNQMNGEFVGIELSDNYYYGSMSDLNWNEVTFKEQEDEESHILFI